MSDATCKTCPYCEPLGFNREGCNGECHRTSPLPTQVEPGSSAFFAIWPQLAMESDWCGSHPERQPHLECATTTLVGRETFPTESDMRRIVDALELMARCAEYQR